MDMAKTDKSWDAYDDIIKTEIAAAYNARLISQTTLNKLTCKMCGIPTTKIGHYKLVDWKKVKAII